MIDRVFAKWAGVCVAIALLVSGLNISAAAADAERFRLLSYNTHGLPSPFAGPKPEKRFAQIGKLTESFDLALLQEDFGHHDALAESLTDPTHVMRGARSDMRPCLFCTGLGLTILSNLSGQNWSIEVEFLPFTTCSGWLSQANDCLAQKGFQLSTLQTPNGRRVVIVNSHLDAGTSHKDRAARAIQLDHIAETLEDIAADQAVVIAGDFNLDWDTPADRALLTAFQGRLGLFQAGNGVQAERGWEMLDYILFRSGKGTTLGILDSGEDLAFEQDGLPLSDHPALFVDFLVQ